MGHTTVRISDSSHRLLRRLAEGEKVPMQALIEKALEAYRRQRFLEKVNEGYAALRRDGAASAALETELVAWERTLGDGLPATRRKAAPARGRTNRGKSR